MSLEQRMDDALSDFAAMVTEGLPIDKALEICANEYSFPVEALKLRAEKRWGDLGSVRERNQQQAEILTSEHKVERAILRYLAEKPDVSFAAWFEVEIGRPPTKAERKEALTRRARSIANDLFSELNNAPNH